MADDRVAGLKIYSLGIVVQPKVRGSDTIVVHPIEAMPMVKGNIGPDTRSISVSLPDQHGVPKNSEVKGGDTIKAKWIAYGDSNRESAPDVQPSETVLIFAYADTQDFYWTTIFREPMLRRLETVRRMYSNQPSGQVPYDDDTAYWTEVSTHDKRMQLQTAINDGEKALYNVDVNGGEGFFLVTDDFKNYLRIDSPDLLVQLVNGAKTYIREDQEKLYTGANEFICETAPVIYLNTPALIVGVTGCGVDPDDEEVYHHRPFLHISQKLEHARIGNAYEAYAHYDGKDINSIAKDNITETSVNKKTEAEKEIVQSTDSHRTSAGSEIVQDTASHRTTAGTEIVQDTASHRTTATDEIVQDTASHRTTATVEIIQNTKNMVAEVVEKYEIKTDWLEVNDQTQVDGPEDEWPLIDLNGRVRVRGGLDLGGESVMAMITRIKGEIMDAIGGVIQDAMTPLGDKITALETKVKDLEDRVTALE